MENRRSFLTKTALASGAIFIPSTLISKNALSASLSNSMNELEVFIFSKHLQFLNYKDMCEATKEMGFDGVDLTVRPKGHILPQNVSEDLPKATEFMKLFGLIPKMISTNVLSAKEHLTVLETAKNLGYQYYRTAWVRYKDRNILTTLEQAKATLLELAIANKEIGITGAYHNHSGNFVGAAIWDLHHILKDVSPKNLGCQYDIMHATVEGGKNWEYNFELIKPYINSLVIKDFKWGKVNNTWKPIFTPLGEGMVDFHKYFTLLKKNNIHVPISLHVEYDLGGAEHGSIPTMKASEILKKIKRDLDFIRNTWQNVHV
jgi:sugar phosphate isomerase/epimerase